MGHTEAPEEPNLVPLLDLVLQMVMFFMACTNFAMENINESVKLPLAQSAKPVDNVGTDIVYVNVDQQGNLLVPSEKNYPDGKIDGMVGKVIDEATKQVVQPGTLNRNKRNDAIRAYLVNAYKNNEIAAKARKDDPGVVRTMVILRAHSDADFRDVYEVLKQCRSAGFKKMQLRATVDQK